jgi:glycosyltransferase involved in cell wall biosynthesis
MKFSIVIPNYNGGATLERAIRSLIDQNYPDLQIIVCDSESKDNSREIIEKYRPQLDTVIIEKDKGQPDGLNKGFARATGDIYGWLCSDDELAAGALAAAAKLFEANPDADMVIGGCQRLMSDGTSYVIPAPDPKKWDRINIQCCVEQPSTFWRSALHKKVGPLDISYFLAFDWDFWNRLHRAGAKLVTTDQVFSNYYFSQTNKTSSAGNRQMQEMFRVVRKYGPMWGGVAHIYRFLYNHFDLHGCYDKPPTCTLLRSHMFVWTLAFLRVLIGQDLLYLYNWHYASCQQRNLKWW